MKKGSPKDKLNADPIIWGRNHEKDAIDTYKFVLGLTTTGISHTSITVSNEIYKPHQRLKIKQAGFRVCKDKPYIGVSCDAYISCACCGNGVIEAKCPWRWSEHVSPANWPADKTGHLETLSSLRTTHKYYTQVQMEMYVCKTEYADFITWTPRQTVIFRVKRDEGFISRALDTISRFWARHVYPKLAGVPSELEHQESTDTASEQEFQGLDKAAREWPIQYAESPFQHTYHPFCKITQRGWGYETDTEHRKVILQGKAPISQNLKQVIH
ncbi:uncharacterized protein PAE49_020042 [Odontesthes bonariensis]